MLEGQFGKILLSMGTFHASSIRLLGQHYIWSILRSFLPSQTFLHSGITSKAFTNAETWDPPQVCSLSFDNFGNEPNVQSKQKTMAFVEIHQLQKTECGVTRQMEIDSNSVTYQLYSLDRWSHLCALDSLSIKSVQIRPAIQLWGGLKEIMSLK